MSSSRALFDKSKTQPTKTQPTKTQPIFPNEFRPISVKKMVDTNITVSNHNHRVVQLLQAMDSPLGILHYGQQEIDNIANKSDITLTQIDDSNVDFITDQLSSILTMAQKYNPTDKNANFFKKALTSLKNGWIDTKETSLSQINGITTQMDRVVDQINQSANTIHTKIDSLSLLYEDNLKDYNALTTLIEDAKVVVGIKKSEYDAFISTPNLSPLEIEKANTLKQQLDRLDKKLITFEKMQFIAMQTAPTIRSIQDNGYTLLEKFHVIKTITIPMWKRQAKLHDDASTIHKGALLANSVDDANNNLMLANANKHKENAVMVAKLGQRDVIDTSTLIEVNKSLIDTFTEVLNIDSQGRQERENSRKLIADAKQAYGNVLIAQQKY